MVGADDRPGTAGRGRRAAANSRRQLRCRRTPARRRGWPACPRPRPAGSAGWAGAARTTFRNRNSGRSGGSAATLAPSRSSWCSSESGSVTPNSGRQWLSANSAGQHAAERRALVEEADAADADACGSRRAASAGDDVGRVEHPGAVAGGLAARERGPRTAAGAGPGVRRGGQEPGEERVVRGVGEARRACAAAPTARPAARAARFGVRPVAGQLGGHVVAQRVEGDEQRGRACRPRASCRHAAVTPRSPARGCDRSSARPARRRCRARRRAARAAGRRTR